MDEAVAGYREVLRLKPDTVEARANLAVLFAGQKQFERAAEQIGLARKIVPKQPSLAFQQAQLLLQAKKPQQAVAPLRDVARLDPKSPAPALLLAQVLTELKRPQQALEAWERLARLDPKSSKVALAAGAMAFEGTKEPARAVKWLRRAVELAPPEPGEFLLLGRALVAAKQPREASQVLARGWKQFPQAVEIGTTLSDARIASGDLPGATGALREVIKRVPESSGQGAPSGQLRLALARLLATQKKFAPALLEINQAARLLPREADVRGMGVDIALRAGDFQSASSNLDAMLAIDAKRFPARILVAREAARRKQFEAANEQYAKYLQKRTGDAGIVAERAVVLEKMGRTDEADALWKRAQVLLPHSALPGLQRGRALRDAGRDKDALQAFRYVLQNFAADPNALFEAAKLEMKLGQPARALARWKALVQARPEFEPGYASLLEAARQSSQLPSALGFLKQQAARNANRDAMYEAVLNVHARIGQAREGQAWVSSIARLYPSARAPRRALALFARRFPSLAKGNDPKPDVLEAQSRPTSGTQPRATPASPADANAP